SMPANLRVLELVAREKACEYPERACHGDSCPLARGFYDKLPVARTAALAIGWLDRPALRAVALAHEVCPYYLSQDLARWSDVVIGDYNYYFDLNAMLYGLTLQNQWRVGVLVDEAHNLVERGRKMVGASLQHADFRRQRATAPAALKKDFDRLGRRWSELRKTAQGQDVRYEVLAGVPEKFLFALQQLGTAIMDLMNERPLQADQDLLGFYFDLLHFTRVAELVGSSVDADSHTLVDLSRSGDDGTAARPARAGALPAAGLASATTLCLRNIVPAYLLAPRWKAAHCAALFSATLSPPQFYRDMLGLPEDTVSIEVDSPFQAEQLTVRVAGAISTRYQHRDASALPIVELMAQQFAERPGNYLAFFSSFDYLHSVAAALRQQHPQIAVWEQARRMDEAAREQFLDAFVPSGQGIGFAVLGGVFGEGVDLPGDRLIGAFIATLGLPQWNPVNEQMRLRMQALYGTGYDYVYLYPGLQKVVQAAGRVIRTQQDRGVVYLIDDRFAQPQVRALLPEWWHVEHFTQRGKRQQVLET
ncbi:MAG: ATP-dependent DNA helicase, partial [Janthinobacterium lividum]